MRVDDRPVKLAGSALARGVLRVFGWKVVCNGLPARQGVLIIYPHTSNWDFLIGILAKWAIGIPAAFFIKDSFFKVPLLRRWMSWIGGFPIDRSAPQGIVGQMGEALLRARGNNRFLWVAITPEGTRSYRESWRTGFYHVTLAARVPLGMAAFDYGRREVRFDTFLQLSGNAEADMAEIAAVFGDTTGKRPALAAPIRLKP
jgi:1-acyl-sn-glycerol-3-phosphate acyltransferase